MGTFKTEAVKGNKEYKPKKTLATPSEEVVKENWSKEYRDTLIKRLRQFKPIEAKNAGQGLGDMIVGFNGNLEDPSWFFIEDALYTFPIWSLRDIAVLLENRREGKL